MSIDEITHAELVKMVLELSASNALLRHEVDIVRIKNAAFETENITLKAENAALTVEIAHLKDELGKKGDPPHWAKANKPKHEAKEKKAREKGASRRCNEKPDEIIKHSVDICPHCQAQLPGGWEAYTRETIQFPQALVRFLKHICMAQRCGVCGHTVTSKPDPEEYGIVGKHRIDARGMSLVCNLHTYYRLPLRQIQNLLSALYQVTLSVGEIRNIIDATAARAKADYEMLRDDIRQSPAVHFDETGWREDGKNGYIWAVSTAKTRYFEYHKTRSGEVPVKMLGKDFTGVITCDGYKGYNKIGCWLQRCWVHMLRKGHEMRAKYPDESRMHRWVDRLKKLYRRAREFITKKGYAKLPESTRQKNRLYFQQALLELVTPYQQSKIKEQANLAIFMATQINEMFVFVELPYVIPENNPAERSVRPDVIARKISGGTRTEQGSKTRMILSSIIRTCHLRNLDPIASIQNMLLGHPIFANSAV